MLLRNVEGDFAGGSSLAAIRKNNGDGAAGAALPEEFEERHERDEPLRRAARASVRMTDE